MTRFSQIAHSIAKLYDPDFNFDPGSPPVRYIEHRLLELAETLDARLTALEAKQAKRPMAIHLETALDEAQADIERQADEIKRLEAVCDDLSDKLDAANEIIAALKATSHHAPPPPGGVFCALRC